MRRVLVSLAATLFLAPSAYAVDGVLEISQACAGVGCFAGDAEGWPVEIDGSAGRSYRLTSDLVFAATDTGIEVAANDISIDLGGFEIVSADCVDAVEDCTPAAVSAHAIETVSSPSAYRGTSVKNGSVTGMGGIALALGEQSAVSNVRLRWNADVGIAVGGGSLVSGNTVHEGGGGGILGQDGSTISGNIVYQNSYGIQGNSGSILSGNTTYANDNFGIAAGNGATISNNTAYQNSSYGINAGEGATVINNSAYQNSWQGINAGAGSTVSGNTANKNSRDGIRAGAGSTVTGNTVRGNTFYGLSLLGAFPNEPGYAGNVISNNAGGNVDGGVEFGPNLCDGNVGCLPPP